MHNFPDYLQRELSALDAACFELDLYVAQYGKPRAYRDRVFAYVKRRHDLLTGLHLVQEHLTDQLDPPWRRVDLEI